MKERDVSFGANLDLLEAGLSQHLLQFANLGCASHAAGVSRPISSDFVR